jgi:flagellar biosynthesis/type III secretory pathway chaperone
MSSVDARRHLRALLEDFDRVLAGEYEALRQRDNDSLEEAVVAKQQLVEAISTASRQCELPAASAGLNPEESEEWAQIRALLARCALANRTNGAAIDASRHFVNTLLDLLCGQTPGKGLYNARGRVGDAGRTRDWERV